MEDMLATLPRVVSVPPVSGVCLPPQDLSSGGQIGGGFGRGSQDDPRCNGTLRKQASPRSSTLGPGSALTAGQGKAMCVPEVGKTEGNRNLLTKCVCVCVCPKSKQQVSRRQCETNGYCRSNRVYKTKTSAQLAVKKCFLTFNGQLRV